MAIAKLTGGERLRWWCPGCESNHVVPVKPNAVDGWDFNGDLEAPTLSPSVLIYSRGKFLNPDLDGEELTAPANKTTTPRCHSFVRDGRIEFLPDCEHELAGQTVPMGPVQ